MKNFDCSLFLDDDAIVQESVSAPTPERAVSLLLSKEASRRGIPYIHLLARVLPGGALAREVCISEHETTGLPSSRLPQEQSAALFG